MATKLKSNKSKIVKDKCKINLMTNRSSYLYAELMTSKHNDLEGG